MILPLQSVPVTVTITITTPRRGLPGHRRLGQATLGVDLPVILEEVPEAMQDGELLVSYRVDTDALQADLTTRITDACAAFTRSTE